MATHLNIPSKVEGSTLSSSEFNALVVAINENATSVEDLYEQLKDKLDIAEIKVDATTTVRILSVRELIEYINEYGTATDVYNTPPVIKIKQTTYIYKVGQELSFDIELYDIEGGELTLTGINPTVSNGYNTFTLTGLRSGANTIDLNLLVYNNTTSKLPVGTYNFKEIFVIDKLGRSSVTPVNILIVVGNISLISAFDSTYSYKPNTAISVRYGISSITNTNKITYKLTGKMLIDDGVLDLYYQSFSEVSEIINDYKLTANDDDFITGNVYYLNYVLPLFENIGDYTLSITVEGLGEVSDPLLVNIVVNKDGILYSATTFDVNGSYYAGDGITIPVNIFYNQTEDIDYTYKCNAWIDGLSITGESDLTSEQKNILLKLTLPDDPDLYTIKFKTTIITPSNEVYKTNINYVAVLAKQKSKYAVLTDSSSKLELYLTGKGKSNASPNWLTWENRYNLDLKYFGSLYNFSKVVNGWEEQVNGVSYYGDTLYASGDAYCSINYQPFENFDTKKESLTVEFSIRHGDLVSDSNYNLSIGKPNSYPKKGIYVKNYQLIINGLNSTINIPLICDNKVLTKMGEWETGDEYAHVAITFNYDKKEVFVYMNGVLSSYGTFSDAANLTHNNPIIFNGYLNEADLVVGKADSKIRFIRIYKTCLTADLVVSNYIASYPDDEERILLEDLNDEVNPILSQAYLKGDRAGIIKDEARRLFFSFISGSEIRVTNTYIPDPIAVLGTYSLEYMDMKKEFPVDVDLQGNSSLSYPIKNYGMDIYDGEAWDTSRSVVSKYYNMVYNADKITTYRPWMNWDSYHLKANYIDSSHCNNLIIAKLADKIFRLPYNWSDLSTIFPLTDPFKNYTVTRPDGTIDNYSRFPVYPPRVSVDGFPFMMRADYTDSNNKEWEKVFCGLYTWNLKQSRYLYGMGGSKISPNLRLFIYRSDSNGDSVHEQLRSGYCKFRDLTKEPLYLDDKERIVSDTYRVSQEAKEMFDTTNVSEYNWYLIGSSEGYLQPNGLYTWIKYGITQTDSNLSDSPISKIYIGLAIDKNSSVKSTLYSDYKWTSIDIQDGVSDNNNTYTLIQYASDLNGTNIGSSITNMNYIGFKYKKTKRLWQVGVDYFDKTGDPTEMSWRPGAELIMDWECREPKDLGQGHWEEYKNNKWVQTNNIISAKDLDANSAEPNKVLRFVWDKIIETTGDAKRTGTTLIDYWTSILDSNKLIQSLSDPSQTFSAIDKTKATVATNQHVDFLNAINWLSNSSDECFSNPKIFEKYFDLRSCLDYVLTCLTFCLTDSIGRNLTMISFDSESVKIAPGVMDRLPMRFYPAFYDIDTAFGTNVQGGLYSTPYVAWPYEIGTRYTPAEGAGQEYNCFGTLFFKRISKCYEAALCRRYLELRSGTVDPVDGKTNISAPFDYLSILLLYTKQIVGRVGERYFNEDAVYKYIGFDADPDETAKRNYITNARGNKVMFMKNFLKKRMDYIDSIMGYVPDTEDMAYLQHYSKGQMTLTFETNVAGYIRISFAQNQATSIYCDGINPVSISYNYPEVTQHILRIYNCGIITSMSGLANKDVRIARLNSMVNLKKLDLKGNPNFGMEVSTLEISKCKSLRTIDLTGCNGPTMFTPDISGCVLLEEFLVSNSSLGSCSFSNNLNLKTIDITGCPYFTVLDVSNLYKLTSLSYDLEKLISLNISNSLIIIDFSLPNTYNNLKALSIVNNKNITQLLFTSDSFINLVLLNISDCSKLTTVKDLFKNRTGYPALNKDFLARCPLLTTVESLFENSSLVTIPSLTFLGSNNIKSLKYLFKNCLKLQSIPNDVLDSLPMLEDITEIFYGSLLLYYTDITEVDENDKIIITGKNVSNVFLGNNIFSNCPKLKYITGAFLNSEIINIPTNIFLNSPLIQVADTCFAGILNNLSSFNNIKQYVKIPTSLFISCPNLLSISNIFKDSYINSVHNNIFNDCPKLITAYGVFNNTEISLIPSQIFLTSGYLTILTLSYAFASKNISSIYDNFLNNYPLLQNIQNIFLSSGITSLPNGFLVTNKISKFKFSDLGIPNINTINYDIFNGSTYLTDISNLFSNTKIISTPNDFLSNNLAISNIDNLFENSIVENIGLNFLLFNNIINSDSIFLNRTSPINLGDNFMKNSLELLSCNNMFSGCTGITSTPINMMSNCPKLLSALNMFYNATSLATINTGLLSNVPLLSEVSGLFKNAIFVSIPDNVLITTGLLLFKFSTILTHKVLVSSQFLSGTNLLNINELYKDTLIETIKDNSFNGHPIINPIGVFTGSKIKTIGNNCFDLIKIQDASYMFSNENEQYIYSIGNDFMKNSDVENMEGMFYNNISIISIGSNFMGSQNKVTTVKDMFNGCVNLGLISPDFLSNAILLTNVLRLFNNCSKITSLSLNIFDNSTLINNIDSFISGTLIKSIPDNFMPNNTGLLNINSLLTGSLIESIGNNFMESSNINTLENTFLSSNLKTIGNNFLLNSKVLNANNAFKNCLLLTTIGDYFLKGNPLETADYCFGGDVLLTNLGLDFFKNIATLLSAKYIFNNTNLSNLPNGFFDGCINLTTVEGLLFNNNITIIPTGFLSGNTGLTSFRFSTFTNKDFTIPADFLQGCLGTVSIDNLFMDSPITAIPDNFFHNLVSVNPTNLFTNSAIVTIGNNCFDSVQMSDASYMFSGTTHGKVESIGDNFMINSKVQSLESTFNNNLTIKTIGDNFMGIDNNLTTLLDCFNRCSNLISVGLGFADNAPNLISIVRVFFDCSSLLEFPIGMLNNSPLINDAMGFIWGAGITSIPDGFMPNNTGLSSLDNMTWGWNITHIGNGFMLNKKSLQSIDGLFKDSNKLKTIGDNFLSNSLISSANGLFQNCSSLQSIGDNFLSGCPLTSANHFFDGALALATIGDNFFTDFTNLVDITYFFNNTTISELPTDFLINCLKVNSLEGVFLNNKIQEIPDYFLVNNNGITSLFYNNSGVLTSCFYNTKINRIGDMFMYKSTGISDISSAFEDNLIIKNIGNLFFAKSNVQTANKLFKNCHNLYTIKSGLLYNSQLLYGNEMFYNCSSLKNIGNYSEWATNENIIDNYYLIEDDYTKCNTFGLQAEVLLFTDNIYKESEFESLNTILSLSNISNIFYGSSLIRLPKGFLSKVNNYDGSSSISSFINDTSIKFINYDLFDKSLITDLTNMFLGTNIESIPKHFISKYNGKAFKFLWGSLPKLFVNNSYWGDNYIINTSSKNKIKHIPYTFLNGCSINNDSTTYGTFYGSCIKLIQDDWCSWNNINNNINNIGFHLSLLSNLPRNYFKLFIGTYGFGKFLGLYESFCDSCSNMDTIIPENFLLKTSKIYTHLSYTTFNNNYNVKGIIPKSFLKYLTELSPNQLFNYLIGIIGLEKGLFSSNIKLTDANAYEGGIIYLNMFLNCSNLKYIPDSFLYNSTNISTINTNLKYVLSGTSVVNMPKYFEKINIVSDTSYAFYNSKITNETGDFDLFFIRCFNNNSLITTVLAMFYNSRIHKIPDNSFKNITNLNAAYACFQSCTNLQYIPDDIFSGCPNLNNISSLFRSSSLSSIPSNFMSTGTTANCNVSDLFRDCVDLAGTIPFDFMKNVKANICFEMFYNCSKLTGTVPSNFLLASSGIITELYNMFYSCYITGFENDTWNITDFSKVTKTNGMFNGSKITKLPTCFYLYSFDSLTDCSSFARNSSIQTIEDNFLPNALKLTTLSYAFQNCKNLVSVGNNFINNGLLLTDVSYIFANDSALLSIGSNFIINSQLVSNISNIFSDTALSSIIPANFLNSSTKITNANSAFTNTKIISIESGNIFERLTTGNSCYFVNTFRDCLYFTGLFPSLWTLYSSNLNHTLCFIRSINAGNYSSIPSGWK